MVKEVKEKKKRKEKQTFHQMPIESRQTVMTEKERWREKVTIFE